MDKQLFLTKIGNMNAIITGATKGIGRAIAQKFAENDINLVICSRSEQDLEETRNSLLAINSRIDVFTKKTDLSIKQETIEFAEFCKSCFREVDILINNAGVFIPGEILKEEEGALELMMQTNLYSVYHLTRRLHPVMEKSSTSYIINIASIASFMAYPNGGSYSISKFALRGFSKVLREELKSSNIKVTTVMPGATWSHSWAGVDLPEDRLMKASDIAESIWSILQLSPSAVVEEITLRPQLGDL